MKTHTVEKAYECSQCNSSFSQKITLKYISGLTIKHIFLNTLVTYLLNILYCTLPQRTMSFLLKIYKHSTY